MITMHFSFKKAQLFLSFVSLVQSEVQSQKLFEITGGPLDMRILGLGKTRISGKSHSENLKVLFPYVHDFSLICEIKITFAADCLHINY